MTDVVVATLKDTRTGEVKKIRQEGDRDSLECLWLDGNYSCDCNRSRFFYDNDAEKELSCNSNLDEPVIELMELYFQD